MNCKECGQPGVTCHNVKAFDGMPGAGSLNNEQVLCVTHAREKGFCVKCGLDTGVMDDEGVCPHCKN